MIGRAGRRWRRRSGASPPESSHSADPSLLPRLLLLPGLGDRVKFVQGAASRLRHPRGCILTRTAVSGLGAGQVAAVVEQDPEVERGGRVPALIAPAVSGFCALKVAPLYEHVGQVECAAGIAAFIGPAVGGFRAAQVTPLLEQHTEVRRSRTVSALIGASVRPLCAVEIASLREQSAEVERRGRIASLIGLSVGRFARRRPRPRRRALCRTPQRWGPVPVGRRCRRSAVSAPRSLDSPRDPLGVMARRRWAHSRRSGTRSRGRGRRRRPPARDGRRPRHRPDHLAARAPSRG